MPQRSRTQHQEAVSRRLAQLSAELAASRPELPAATVGTGEADGVAAAGDDWWADHTRVAAPRPALQLVPAPPQPPVPPAVPGPPGPPGPPAGRPPEVGPAPAVPQPGRHAARRRLAPGRAVAQLVPEPLRGPVGLGPGQLAVVAVLVAVGLAVTCWWVVRGDPEPTPGRLSAAAPASAGGSAPAALETPAAVDPAGAGGAAAGSATAVEGGTASGAASGSGVPVGSVTVDVAGKVRRPGIAVLDAGSRVVDALEAAGGARPGVDLSSLNLARVLVDGEQVLVGAPAAPVAAAAVPGTSTAPAGALVNLNTATAADLELLPEVGPVTAQSIVAWRDEHGGFTAVDELLEVDGIGDKTLATIAPHVTV